MRLKVYLFWLLVVSACSTRSNDDNFKNIIETTVSYISKYESKKLKPPAESVDSGVLDSIVLCNQIQVDTTVNYYSLYNLRNHHFLDSLEGYKQFILNLPSVSSFRDQELWLKRYQSGKQYEGGSEKPCLLQYGPMFIEGDQAISYIDIEMSDSKRSLVLFLEKDENEWKVVRTIYPKIY